MEQAENEDMYINISVKERKQTGQSFRKGETAKAETKREASSGCVCVCKELREQGDL